MEKLLNPLLIYLIFTGWVDNLSLDLGDVFDESEPEFSIVIVMEEHI
jgi:hypothetical protein